MRTEITLPLGYSPIYTPDSEYREFFEYLFGPYTELRFRVEEVGELVQRICVEGSDLRRPHRPHIEEQFTSRDKFVHRTKNGHALRWSARLFWPQGEITLSMVDESQVAVPSALAAAE